MALRSSMTTMILTQTLLFLFVSTLVTAGSPSPQPALAPPAHVPSASPISPSPVAHSPTPTPSPVEHSPAPTPPSVIAPSKSPSGGVVVSPAQSPSISDVPAAAPVSHGVVYRGSVGLVAVSILTVVALAA
ncbi:hypothetical protein DCAR_0624310 [Daucus carota subsp. sativus]|uniref:Uncharacterized protein n=1 Tax=Daucus carota subsp. sativus TaxID=79200 RepID=A0A164VRR0_DAUCS|nr:PREDICTED: lysine-rich arabinogalactan protein 19-like [Daucus carota subsp. sativus]WOH04898.1 hypothetical protein DCAR_0624310 [Daucus carota subsp. sativus]